MPKSNGHLLIPSAKRLITSLRDMGYDFSGAVADLVDNSIEAKASRIDIDAEFFGDDSWLRIADNGRGMTPAQLREALRFGADRSYEETDLGRFGLGLKTASMSQCQRLSVASRTSKSRVDISAYCWDMQHIINTNKWEILPLPKANGRDIVRDPLQTQHGTSVLWQRLDRLLGYERPYGDPARKKMSNMCRELERHLAMVFHKFISREVRGRAISITLNTNKVEPWDPFVRSEKATKVLEPIEMEVEFEGKKGSVKLEPYILPTQNEFSSMEAFRLASGPLNWNQQQGFYIYRADRMIQSGGWCRLRAPDEHCKSARIALSFSPKLDSAFKINVSKMQVQLPAQIRDQIEEAIRPIVRLAQERYRKSAKKHYLIENMPAAAPPKGAAQATHVAEPSPARYGEKKGGEAMWTLDQFDQELSAAANGPERPIVKKVMARLRKKLGDGGGK